MKTFIFRSLDGSTKVDVKSDAFATNTQLLSPGFDTKLTAMQVDDTEAAIALGINVNELDYSYQDLVAMAKAIPGIGLSVADLSDASNVSSQAQVDNVTLSGTSGTANVSVNTVDYLTTFNTNLSTTADDFVASHAAALTTAGITVTHPGADGVLVFTADVAGVAFAITEDIETVSGDLDGTRINVTLNQTGGKETTLVQA